MMNEDLPDYGSKVWKSRVAQLEELLDHVASGGTVRSWCRCEDYDGDDRPAFKTVYRWINLLEKHAHELVTRFARARGHGYDAIADQMLEIADEEPRTTGAEGSERIDPGDVQNRKLRIETREKLLAKWDPGRYGVKVAVEHTVDDKIGDVLEAARLRVLARTSRMVNPVAEEGGDLVE